MGVFYRYVDRVNVDSFHLFDLGVGVDAKRYSFNVNINNLFGVEYSEFPNIPMPTRWTRATLRVKF